MALLVVSSMAGCGALRGASAVDDLARVSRLSADDVELLAQREASAGGGTTDDVAQQWLPRVQGASNRASDATPEVRESACEIASDWMDATLTGRSYAWTDAATTLMQNVSANPAPANISLAEDVWAAIEKAKSGDSNTLQLLVLKSAACTAVSSY